MHKPTSLSLPLLLSIALFPGLARADEAPAAATTAPDWPATVQTNAPVHYFVADRKALATSPAWQASLSFADDGDQTFDVIRPNGVRAVRSTDTFLNIADTNYTAWADAPSVDVLLQVFGDGKLLDTDGKGREVLIRTGTLGHENLVDVGRIPDGVVKGQWNWLLFTVTNGTDPKTGKHYLGNLPNPDDANVEYGGVNHGTLRLEHVPGITIRAVAVGQHGDFGTMKAPNVFEPFKK